MPKRNQSVICSKLCKGFRVGFLGRNVVKISIFLKAILHSKMRKDEFFFGPKVRSEVSKLCSKIFEKYCGATSNLIATGLAE
jgi:hypothetical protein